jgi:tRNA U34 5-carboxymethylaminomethyl modifying GTPase MnmE/TrmE
MSKSAKNEPAETPEKNGAAEPKGQDVARIEAIKQLIFGENIQQIDSDFQQVRDELDKKKQELEYYIALVNKQLTEAMDNLETDINIRITELERSTTQHMDGLQHTKTDRKQLGELLVSLGEKIMQDY